MSFPDLPPPPYYAVIFSARLNAHAMTDYPSIGAALSQLASQQNGYLGHESLLQPDGRELTISYWTSEAAIKAWKQQQEHQQAQTFGKKSWFHYYAVRVAIVERAYEFDASKEQW